MVGIPTDGSCVNWNAGAGGYDAAMGKQEPGAAAPEWRGAGNAIDYTFEGKCIAKKYEGAFDDPTHSLMAWLNGLPKDPINFPDVMRKWKPGTVFVVGGLILAVVSSILTKIKWFETWHLDEFFNITFFAGSAALFLGMFVLDKSSSLVAAFIILALSMVSEVAKTTLQQDPRYKWFKTPEEKSLTSDDDLIINDKTGTETTTKYMDFTIPLAKLTVLFFTQVLLVWLLCSEVVNFWDDEGAEYDQVNNA